MSEILKKRNVVKRHTKDRSLSSGEFDRRSCLTQNCCLWAVRTLRWDTAMWHSQSLWELRVSTLPKEALPLKRRLRAGEMGKSSGPGGRRLLSPVSPVPSLCICVTVPLCCSGTGASHSWVSKLCLQWMHHRRNSCALCLHCEGLEDNSSVFEESGCARWA